MKKSSKFVTKKTPTKPQQKMLKLPNYLGILIFAILIYFYVYQNIEIYWQNHETIDISISAPANKYLTNFVQLDGLINDCNCEHETLERFNNLKIYPRMKSLLLKNYFRFYKVNLKQKCPFWPDDYRCAIRYCKVENCDTANIPEGLKKPHETELKKHLLSKQNDNGGGDVDSLPCSVVDEVNEALGSLDTSLSEQSYEEFKLWAKHDDQEDEFCILDDFQEGAEYVDLLLNPERYTGYQGPSANHVWQSIYLENCFSLNNNNSNSLVTYMPHLKLNGMCTEHRTFYRLISGLHASINVHLCANYLLSEPKNFFDTMGVWGPNLNEFKRRFSPQTTNGEGPNWLRNLYFLYLVELRAIAKAAPYLRYETYYTGVHEEDMETKMAIDDILNQVESFSSHFNEKILFSNGNIDSNKLKQLYKEKFRNITSIMDCVGCEKCRLWGKLQTQGLGTALKILYSDTFNLATENGIWEKPNIDAENIFRLKRSEIVALFNAFGRLSTSIYHIDEFRNMLS